MSEQPSRNQYLLPALLLLAAVFALTQLRSVPPAPQPAGAPADQFSAARAREVLNGLVGDGVPHPIGSEANARVRERVIAQLTALGYQAEPQDTFVCAQNAVCANVRNIIARLDGREQGKAVLVATHYDSVWAGPGASDAGTSVAIVLEVARALKQDAPHRNPILLLIDDGEEAGLLGAQAFASQHPDARRVGAVVNLEARGASGQSVMFETGGDNAWLIGLLARSLSRPAASSLFYPIYERLPNDTDLTVFKRFGMPGVNFAFIGEVPKYHTPLDSVQNASSRSLQHQGDNALAIARALADADLAAPPPGDAVFFDLLGLVLIRWPAQWTLALAVVALVLVVACLAASLRAGLLRWSRLVAAFALWIIMPVVSGIVAFGLMALLTRVGGFRGDATASPIVATVTFWLLAATILAAAAALTARWTGRAAAWAGCWFGWASIGVALSVLAPEASYIAIVPSVLAGLAGLSGTVFRRGEPGWFALALPMVAAAVLWMSPAWFLFDALGVPILPAVSGVVTLMLTPVTPFFSGDGSRWRLAVPGAGAAATVACAVLVWSSPSFSEDRPEPLNLTFFQEAGGSSARWLAAPQSGAVPAAMREAAPFGSELTKAYPWSTAANVFAAPATAVESPGPDLQVLERGARDGRRFAGARLLSPRGAPVVVLVLPADRVLSVTMGGREIPRRTTRESGRAVPARGPAAANRSYACLTVPAEGIEIEVMIAGDEPVEGYVFDRSAGLPPSGAALRDARPAAATVIGSGDTTVLASRVKL